MVEVRFFEFLYPNCLGNHFNYWCFMENCDCWVLQLGAGTSLPGLVAAKVGADVTITDHSDRLEVYFSINFTNLNLVSIVLWGLH